jgi:hypothetical protein
MGSAVISRARPLLLGGATRVVIPRTRRGQHDGKLFSADQRT